MNSLHYFPQVVLTAYSHYLNGKSVEDIQIILSEKMGQHLDVEAINNLIDEQNKVEDIW